MGLRTNVSNVLAMRGIRERTPESRASFLALTPPPMNSTHTTSLRVWFLNCKLFPAPQKKRLSHFCNIFLFVCFLFFILLLLWNLLYLIQGWALCKKKYEVKSTNTCRKSLAALSYTITHLSTQSTLTLTGLPTICQVYKRMVSIAKMNMEFVDQDPEWRIKWELRVRRMQGDWEQKKGNHCFKTRRKTENNPN